MKRLRLCLLLIGVYTSVSFAAFDYVISDTFEYGIFPLNSESLLVTGAGADQVFAQGESYIEVQDTAPLLQNIGGIYALDLYDSSTLVYDGGETNLFTIHNSAIATFSGGRIDYISSYQDTGSTSPTIPGEHITFICDVDSIDLTGNLLTGDWLSGGGSFSITLQDQGGYDPVFSNINFVPEPTTLLLLTFGAIALRQRK